MHLLHLETQIREPRTLPHGRVGRVVQRLERRARLRDVADLDLLLGKREAMLGVLRLVLHELAQLRHGRGIGLRARADARVELLRHRLVHGATARENQHEDNGDDDRDAQQLPDRRQVLTRRLRTGSWLVLFRHFVSARNG